MSRSLRQSVGELIAAGLGGTELTAVERAWLRVVRPAGIILFRRNIADAAQTRALLASATTECAPQAFRFVDIEGGTVDRLRDALAPSPSPRAVFAAGRPRLWQQHGSLIGEAVRSFGFNATLAPVVDLALPESEPVMKSRTTSPDPEQASAYVAAFLAGLATKNILGCAKHFPGLGGGNLDSHHATPKIERGFRQLWQQDLIPYRKLARTLPMVMISHAAYPQTRGGTTPASVSRWWVGNVLQKRIGYRGLILSDDLEMGGILKHCSIEEAAIGAIEAGLHLIEICHSEELILRAFEALLGKAEQSSAFRRLLTERANTASRLRAKALANTPGWRLSDAALNRLRQRMIRFASAVEEAR